MNTSKNTEFYTRLFMSNNALTLQESYALASQQLTAQFPWTDKFIIRVPYGFVDIVSELLQSLEEIYSQQSISFLRIITVSFDDFKESELKLLTTGLELKIFIEPSSKSQIKFAAMTLHIDHAKSAIDRICYKCGAEAQAIEDPDDISLYRVRKKKSGVCARCYEAAHEKFGHLITDELNSDAENKEEDDEDDDDPEAISALEVLSSSVLKPKPDSDFEGTEDSEASVKQQQTVAIFTLDQVANLEKSIESETRDQKQRVKALVNKLNEISSNKRLTAIPDNWLDLCDSLAERFPNFSDVVTFIRNQFALASISDHVFRLPPFLLVGPPGVGKTEFLLTLAEEVESVLQVIDIANAQTGSALTGSESYWANTQPGKLFNTLVFGDIANPIFLLDEVDKKASRQDQDPLAGLHGLLEQRQAKQFTDLSLRDLAIDASYVIWCATANEERYIEQSILDRFAIFTIAPPNLEQMRVIVQNQYQKFIHSHNAGRYFEATLSDEAVIAQLSNAHPRKVKKLLEQAFALAALEKRTTLIATDIISSEKSMLHHRSIGFV